MTDKESAQSVIESYRKRQQTARRAPLILGAVAVLLIVGAALLIFWLIGPNRPTLSLALIASKTPTPTDTATPTNTPTHTPTATITPTSTKTPTATATPTIAGPFTYQVVEGDSLFSIAQKFKVDLLLLITANGMDPANPLIRIGEKLNIPGPDTKLPSATPLPKNLAKGAKIQYRVQPGDSLASIALQFNTTIEEVKTENKIKNENEIYVGQVLSIPVNTITVTPTSKPTATARPGTATAKPTKPALTATP